MAVNRPVSYNKPKRRQALLEIRRLLVEEGLSHNEIQLRLNINSSTYWKWLDLLFSEEQAMIAGNHYTYQRLLTESLLLGQRYLRDARILRAISEDKTIAAEDRITAIRECSELERAAHDICYPSPSYLAAHKLLPRGQSDKLMNHPTLRMSRTHTFTQNQSDEEKETEKLLMGNALEYRQENIRKQEQQPSA